MKYSRPNGLVICGHITRLRFDQKPNNRKHLRLSKSDISEEQYEQARVVSIVRYYLELPSRATLPYSNPRGPRVALPRPTRCTCLRYNEHLPISHQLDTYMHDQTGRDGGETQVGKLQKSASHRQHASAGPVCCIEGGFDRDIEAQFASRCVGSHPP